MKKLLLISVALLMAMTFCKKQEKPTSETHKMWNGGKPQAPVSVVADYEKSLKANGTGSLTLTVKPTVACANLLIVINGIEGVQAAASQNQECNINQETSLTTSYSVGNNTAGFITATISFDANNQRISTTKVFSVRTNGTTFASKVQAANANMHISEAENGGKVIILPSEMR